MIHEFQTYYRGCHENNYHHSQHFPTIQNILRRTCVCFHLGSLCCDLCEFIHHFVIVRSDSFAAGPLMEKTEPEKISQYPGIGRKPKTVLIVCDAVPNKTSRFIFASHA